MSSVDDSGSGLHSAAGDSSSVEGVALGAKWAAALGRPLTSGDFSSSASALIRQDILGVQSLGLRIESLLIFHVESFLKY